MGRKELIGMQEDGFYLPERIRIDERFSLMEKFLICEILNQKNKKDCDKTNAYFANLLNCSMGHVINMLSHLRKKGFIENEQIEGKRFLVFHSNPIKYAPTSGFIYFLKGVGTKLTKIGKTKQLNNRIFQLNSILPFEVELLHSISSKNIDKNEIFFHKKYKSKRIKGEWFQLTEEDIECIGEVKEI